MQLKITNTICFAALFVTLFGVNAQTVSSHPDPKEKIENIIELRPMKPLPPLAPGVTRISIPIHPPTNPSTQSSSESFQCHNFAYKFARDFQAKRLTVEVTITAKDSVKFNQVDRFDLSESELNRLLNNRRAFLQTLYKCHDNRLGIHLFGFEWQPENQQTYEVWYSTTLFFDGKIDTLTRRILD
jgi:hypothetical protein